jgi:hypothetical protein
MTLLDADQSALLQLFQSTAFGVTIDTQRFHFFIGQSYGVFCRFDGEHGPRAGPANLHSTLSGFSV